jgi:hypothetical protein
MSPWTRVTVCLLATLILVPALTLAQQCPGMTTQQIAFAKERLAVGAVAVPLTASVYKPSGVTPTLAMVSVEGGAIRYEVIGTPTATDGHPGSGTFPICGLDNIAAFKAIRVGIDAELIITYYKSK